MLFQEFASKHNINWKQINTDEHVVKRARERLGWDKHKEEQIKGNLRALLKNSNYVGEVIDEQGKLSHLFVNERKGIYLSSDFKAINTVMIHNHITYTPLKEIMVDLHKKQIRKLDRKLNARIKRLEDLKYDCNVDLAILKRRKNRTRSNTVKMACQANINGINQTLNEYEKEIKSIQDEKRQITRSMAAIL